MIGMRQVQTPNGMILVPEDQAAAFGLAPAPDVEEFTAPTLPPPPETPVPDVAFAPPPSGVPDAGGPGQAGAGSPVPVVPPPAGPLEMVPEVPGAPAAPPVDPLPPALDAALPPPKPLSKQTYDDLAGRQASDTQAQVAATQATGAAEGAKAQAEADAMQRRDDAAAAKIAEMDQRRAAEEKAIAAKAVAWEAKQKEWMDAKVTRRGMSTGELVMAAIAGLGSALKGQGAQNPALPIIMQKIQQDVDDQIRERDELGKQSSALKGSLDYAREVASSAQAQRLAAYGLEMQRQGQMIETVGKRMESPIKKAQAMETAAALRSEGTAKYGAAMQMQHAEDQAKAAREQAERDSRRRAAEAGARLREDARQFDASDKRIRDLAALDYEKEVAKAVATGDVERAKLMAAQAKEERELAIGGGAALKGGPAPSAAIQQMNELSRKLGIEHRIDQPGFDEKGRLLSRDGSVWKAPDQVSAQALRKQVAATINASNMIDEILRLRDQHGWSSDLMKSSEWRKMQANKGAIIVQMKNAAELGALSGPDMELIESMLGTKDVTEFRDPSDGLRQAKAKMQENTRGTLAVAGYDGDAFNVVDNSKESAAPRDRDIAALMSDEAPKGSSERLRASMASGGAPVVNAMTGEPFVDVPVADAPAPTLSENQELALRDLVKRAVVIRGADGKLNPDADVAVSGLIEAAQRAPTKGARDAAASKLAELAAAGHPLVSLRLQEFRSSMPGSRGR